MKGIFGPRGPSYSYYPNNYPAPSNVAPSYLTPNLNPSYRTSYAYPQCTQYPNASLSPIYLQSPYTSQIQNPIQNFTSYSWGKPEILLPSKGLESVLIAILILVVLDMVFVRPLKKNTY